MSGRRPDRPEHNPRRVVHVINSLVTGGAESLLAGIVSTAGADGPFEHIVLPLRPGGSVEQRVRDTGTLAAPLGVDGAVDLLTAPLRLAARLRELRPDVVQGWLLQGNPAATIGAGLARLGVPVLWNVRWTLYDVESEPFRTRALLGLSGRLARLPTRIVYNSRLAVAQHAAIGFPPGRARVIPNGFDLDRLRPNPAARTAVRLELGIPSDAKVVGMLARYHPMKDHATSLRAAAHLVERGVDAIFVYAGPDVDNANTDLVDLVEDLGLSARVRLLGDRLDAARLFVSFDLYWMSSLASGMAEGFPSAIAEAMACGVPCVTTDSGDAAWIIGRTGRVVPSRNPQALGDAAAELLLLDPSEIRRMGSDARRRIERDFSLESVVGAYEALYDEVLARSH
jgi:glycosyltransferase involved in cell wall biosynthesis